VHYTNCTCRRTTSMTMSQCSSTMPNKQNSISLTWQQYSYLLWASKTNSRMPYSIKDTQPDTIEGYITTAQAEICKYQNWQAIKFPCHAKFLWIGGNQPQEWPTRLHGRRQTRQYIWPTCYWCAEVRLPGQRHMFPMWKTRTHGKVLPGMKGTAVQTIVPA